MRLLVALIAFGLLAAAEPPGTVLILPFTHQSEPRHLDWIGESVSETISEVLQDYGILTVDRRDREEAAERLGLLPLPKFTRASVLKLGEFLDAPFVVAGHYTFAPAGDTKDSKGTLTITAFLLYPRELRSGPEFQESGPIEQLASLQNQIAWRTLQQLAPERAGQESEFHRTRPPVRLDALEQYVRGLVSDEPAEQLKFWTQAARLDPRFHQPAYQLGHLYFERREYQSASDWFRKVPRTYLHFSEATFFLGIARYRLSDFAGAEKAFQMIAEEVPLNEVFNNLGLAQLRRGAAGPAIENLKRAAAGDPSDSDYHFNLGYALWKRGDFAGAAERFRTLLERNSADATAGMMLSRCVRREGSQRQKKEEGLERLKTEYQERAYRQLKAVLEPEREN